jgi:hypothetical protein
MVGRGRESKYGISLAGQCMMIYSEKWRCLSWAKAAHMKTDTGRTTIQELLKSAISMGEESARRPLVANISILLCFYTLIVGV